MGDEILPEEGMETQEEVEQQPIDDRAGCVREENGPLPEAKYDFLTDTVIDAEVDEYEAFDRLEINPNVEMKISPVTKKEHKRSVTESLCIPTYNSKKLQRSIANAPLGILAKNEANAEWAYCLDTSLKQESVNSSLQESLKREGSDWQQPISHGDVHMFAAQPKFASADENTVLTGDRAILAMATQLGRGGIFQIPLWHSGIWLKLRAPLNGAILELDTQIATEKVLLGRKVRGLLYSEDSVYTKKAMTDFILAHVYDCNVRDWSIEKLRSIILLTDYNLMVAGMAATMYPNGYPITHSCTYDTEKCLHVAREVASIPRMFFTDKSRLSEKQLGFMAKRGIKRTVEQIKDYQKTEWNIFENISIDTDNSDFDPEGASNNFSITISVPTLEQYIDSGVEWIDTIETSTNNAFSVALSEKRRDKYITKQGIVSAIRQYASWIKSINVIVNNNMSPVTDRDTINKLCENLSSERTIIDNILVAISKAIDDSTISLFGFPDYECPSCGNGQNNHTRVNPEIIPLDPETIFFRLYTQTLESVTK